MASIYGFLPSVEASWGRGQGQRVPDMTDRSCPSVSLQVDFHRLLKGEKPLEKTTTQDGELKGNSNVGGPKGYPDCLAEQAEAPDPRIRACQRIRHGTRSSTAPRRGAESLITLQQSPTEQGAQGGHTGRTSLGSVVYFLVRLTLG